MRLRLCLVIVLLEFVCAEPRRLIGQEAQKTQATCEGPYKEIRLTPEVLADVLTLHRKWLQKESNGQQANLCDANLRGANLQGASLRGANLQGADLGEANLQRAELDLANLQPADLGEANLQGATLEGANLQRAYLQEANLQLANLGGANLRQAIMRMTNLQGANLGGANLQRAELDLANLQPADLEEANLQPADLGGIYLNLALLRKANLQPTFLGQANLQQALLHGANLQQAYLWGTDLQQAFLEEVNLQPADLKGANLQRVNLRGANLQQARLTHVNLKEARYEPHSVPDRSSLSGITGLSTVWFREGEPSGLVLLRSALKDVGLRSLEREATYALRHTERCYSLPVFCHFWAPASAGLVTTLDGLFHFLFFELTCAYGLTPGRPLLILLSFIPSFACLYGLALRKANRRTGLWVTYSADRKYKRRHTQRVWRALVQHRPPKKSQDAGIAASRQATSALLTVSLPLLLSRMPALPLILQGAAWLGSWGRTCRIALYFSLLSAFHLGWRELNVGTWITRLQQRNYTLSATGWVRAVSGVQSLLSVYLLALWALTYFGRPFE
jgi:uncharacterized protein YjbI with pentapeptide repeats